MSSSETYTVYSKKNCSFCVRAVHLIENQGFKVQVKKIDDARQLHRSGVLFRSPWQCKKSSKTFLDDAPKPRLLKT